ncbi:MAG: hypothetical protein S4CHLAM45_06880 [Chlamydiales bacterium]|nr:hypothetical protein [Chlamydiales bacterium]MCH9620294.1 hypothetical protein [Chlamydiales bacterium]MCH9622795.1 hypothetical protein [Chlamydiales bacterium]
MKQWMLLSSLICTSLIAIPQSESQKRSYEEARRQTKVSFQTDEELFLKPYLKTGVKELAGKIVLNAGLTSQYTQEDAFVCHLDAEEEITNLPYEDETFDEVLSVGSGADTPQIELREVARVLKEQGEAQLATVASYGVVFTDGSRNEHAVFRHIQEVLAGLEGDETPEIICEKLRELREVNRATFAQREGRLILVTDDSQLQSGEEIWRKEGDRVVQGFYHSEEEYLVAIYNAGLKCIEVKRPCFYGQVKYNLYHDAIESDTEGLGKGYIENNPFTIYSVIK